MREALINSNIRFSLTEGCAPRRIVMSEVAVMHLIWVMTAFINFTQQMNSLKRAVLDFYCFT